MAIDGRKLAAARVLLALPPTRGRQPYGCHHAVTVHIKTGTALDQNVHPFLLPDGDLVAVRRGLPSTSLRYALKAAINGSAGPHAMLPRELAASSATGVNRNGSRDSHPPMVAAASAVIACFHQTATSVRLAWGP